MTNKRKWEVGTAEFFGNAAVELGMVLAALRRIERKVDALLKRKPGRGGSSGPCPSLGRGL